MEYDGPIYDLVYRLVPSMTITVTPAGLFVTLAVLGTVGYEILHWRKYR